MLSHLGIENDIAIKLELRNVQGEMQLKIKFFFKKVLIWIPETILTLWGQKLQQLHPHQNKKSWNLNRVKNMIKLKKKNNAMIKHREREKIV